MVTGHWSLVREMQQNRHPSTHPPIHPSTHPPIHPSTPVPYLPIPPYPYPPSTMSQTTLNLIAISVFAITMSSLLGPVIGVSPVAPAIATVGLLGLATLDRFGWEGRGGTILVNWVSGVSAEYRERVLRHEAGHFLAAHLLDIPVTDYTLSAWEAWRRDLSGEGGVVVDAQALEAELTKGALSAQRLDRYGIVWMAGTAAELIAYGTAEGGDDDRQTLQMLWRQLNFPRSEYAVKQRWFTLQARTLIEKNWEAYEALTAAMENKASAEECRQIIQQYRVD
ncbi:MAG: ATP-dependent Zn protease [Leptolyngbyaceae cyanobacterium MO_188.B28]|nr:ATP-dependent Zn protease [Leptolyngbyaceae cyanobacterium MO_188.B28]